jgi:hypothetical protein
MKTAAVSMLSLLLLAGGLSAQRARSFSVRNSENFSGQITDSICAEGHFINATKSGKNCVLACVEFDGAQFVLYNHEMKHTYQLDDQQKPEPLAGQEVIVTGKYDKEANAIHVISIRPRITNTGL